MLKRLEGYFEFMRLGTSGRTGILAGINGCWSYDGFGNRKSEAMSTALCTANPPLASWATYNTTNNNRMDATNQNANQVDGYDAAGNVLNDGVNRYLYDPEGRLCAVQFQVSGTVTAYLCDAEGRRVGKGTLSTWPSSCNAPTAANGFASASQYLLGPGGEQVTELNGSGTPQHTNMFAAGRLLATYDTRGQHFQFTDWLGTRRTQTTAAGVSEEQCQSLLFGDGLSCSGSGVDTTEHHFTGKERDSESGNDFFLARYYNSTTGRFLTPDWSLKAEPVPYARLDIPQTLNLYAYVGNNPLTRTDVDGHVTDGPDCNHPNNPCATHDVQVRQIEDGKNKARAAAQQQKPTAAPAPTTQYKSVKAAGIGAEQTYDPASKSMNREFNGNIYENGQGKCCFIQTPNIGTESTSAPPDVSTLPSGATRVATFHTHGADSHGVYDDEHFSPADIRNTGTRGVPFFLGTPQGVIRMYDPATQKITTFKETAP